MSSQNLIIYSYLSLYHILDELSLDLNFDIFLFDNKDSLISKIKENNNYLIITKKKYLDLENQIIIENLPINISKLLEIINIEFLKISFNRQSEIKVKNYIINFNSREIVKDTIKIKLTEKEIKTIIYLSQINKPVSIQELKKNVWRYQSDIETHTVETHIYRLRKKISLSFNDVEFIINKKDGYYIK